MRKGLILLSAFLLASATPGRAADITVEDLLSGSREVESTLWDYLFGESRQEILAEIKAKAVAEALLAPVPLEKVDAAIDRGRSYLTQRQNTDSDELDKGGWNGGNSAPRWDNIHTRTATTGIVAEALTGGDRKDSARAARIARRYIWRSRHGKVRPEDKYSDLKQRLYALTYGLRGALAGKNPKGVGPHKDRTVDYLVSEIELLSEEENAFAYHPTSPLRDKTWSATHVVGGLAYVLQDAKAAGYVVPDALIETIVKEVETSREGDGNFGYWGGGKNPGGESVESSIGRAPLAEMVLFRAGKSSKERLQVAIDKFQAEAGQLFVQKHDGTHETHDPAYQGRAKYFYLFGFYWAAKAIKTLDDAKNTQTARAMAHYLLADQEADGKWTDTMVYAGPTYGTGMGVLALTELREFLAKHDPEAKPPVDDE